MLGAVFITLGLASCSFIFFSLYLYPISPSLLQRKNGLFKKAYELGVLCSVDVTVIIFGSPSLSFFFFFFLTFSNKKPPEKAGTHSEKLYEYCSTSDGDSQVSKRIDVRPFFSPLVVSLIHPPVGRRQRRPWPR